MTDGKNKEPENKLDGSAQQQIEQLESRRKFTKVGLAGSATLVSLISRPVLGSGGSYGGDNKCTMSLLASFRAGNSSIDPSIIEECKKPGGCTPGFWCPEPSRKPNTQAWNVLGSLGIEETDSYEALFGVSFSVLPPTAPGHSIPDDLKAKINSLSGITLAQAVCITRQNTNSNHGGGGHTAGSCMFNFNVLKQLVRHSAAAYLNSEHPVVNYGLTTLEIITRVQTAYVQAFSNPGGPCSDDIESLKNELDRLNNAGCPLGANTVI